MRRRLFGARRDGDAHYLWLTTVAFGIPVVAVDVYLTLGGDPKIGGGGLHLAHMLLAVCR